MFRLLHVLLTVTALLVCPFNCLGHAAAQDAQAGSKPAKRCACCRHHRPRSRSADKQEDPSPAPCDDCQCGNCLCRGAILTDHDLLSLDVDGAAFGPVPCDLPVAAWDAAPAPRVAADESPPSLGPSGRLIRFALQSLVI